MSISLVKDKDFGFSCVASDRFVFTSINLGLGLADGLGLVGDWSPLVCG